jgi:hypothetical protein
MTACGQVRRWMDDGFVRGFASHELERLRAHIAECDACHRRFVRLDAIGRLATRPLSLDAIDRIQSRVVTPPPAKIAVWVSLGATMIAAATALLLVLRPAGDRDHGLTARGGAGSRERELGVRLLCVSTNDTVNASVGAAALDSRTPALPCTMDDDLQLLYATSTQRGVSMVVFSQDASGRTFWYAPRAATEASIPLDADVRDRALPWATRLGVKHTPGRYEVRVLFFDHSVIAADAESGRETPIAESRATIELAGGAR